MKINLLGNFLLWFFLSPLLHLFHMIIHQSALIYFTSVETDFWTRIRVIPGGCIIFQSHLILLKYLHILYLHLLNWYGGLFPHRVIRCSLEENISRWLLNMLYSEENHRTIVSDFFYLNKCNGMACYPIDFFGIGSRINLYESSKFLGVCG